MGNFLKYVNQSNKKKDEEKEKKSSTSQLGNFGKYAIGKTLGLDTLSSDLTSLSKNLDSVFSGWQTQETMKNTLSSVQSMYDRLGKYQEYQKKYGGADLSELHNAYKSAIDGWDDLSRDYAKYKNADAYKKEKDTLSSLYSMPSSEIKAKMDLKYDDIYKTAKEYDKKVRDIANKAINIKNPSAINTFKSTLDKATKERDEYLKSMGYSSMDELKKAISGVAYTTADGESIMWKDLYNSAYLREYEAEIDKNPSFVQPIEYKKKDANYSKTWNGYAVIGDEFAHKYNYINGDEEAKEIEELTNVNMNGTSDSKKDAFYTEDEKRRFNFIAQTQGEEKALEYANLLDSDLRQRRVDYERIVNAKNAIDNPVATSIVSVIDNLGNNAMALPFMAMDYAEDGSIDPNSSLYTGRRRVQTERGTVEGMIDSDIGQFLYRHGMNIADNLATRAVSLGVGSGVASQFLMSSGAAADTMIEAKERGLSDVQAIGLGAISGAAEWFFESKGFEAWVDTKTLSRSAWKYFANDLKTELVGELFTEGTNDIADYFIAQDLSELNTEYESYLSSGMSDKEAFLKVVKGVASRYVDVAAGTILSTGVMAGPGATIGGIRQHSYNKDMGKNIKANERTAEMFDIASNPELASAYEAYTRYANKGVTTENISDVQLGRLYTNTKLDAVETFQNKDASSEQKQNALKTLGQLANVKTENTVAKRAKELNVGEETKVTESGAAIDIKDFKVKGDKITVATEKGDISVDDMTLTQRDAELVGHAEQILKEEGEAIANLFISQYDGKSDVYQYANDFNLTMAYAKNDYTYDTILRNKGTQSTDDVKKIYAEVRIKADKARQEAIEKLNKEMADKGFYKGFINDSIIDYENTSAEGKINWKDLTERQRKAVTFIKGFAQAAGMNLVFEANNPKLNGHYDRSTNTFMINLDEGGFDAIKNIEETLIPTMSHETTHWMKDKSPELWRSLNETVFSTLTEHYNSNTEQAIKDKIALLNTLDPKIKHTEEDAKGRTITEEDLINAEMKRRGKSEAVAREEIISRACEDILSMSKQGRKIFASLSETEQKTLAEKIKGIIKDLLNWVDGLLKSYEATSTEARIMRTYKDKLQEAVKLWDKMLEQTVEASQSLEKSGKYNHDITSIGSRDLSELSEAVDTEGEKLFQYKAMVEDEDVYREMLHKHQDIIGITKKQINDLFITIDKAVDIISENLNELDYAWDTDINDRAFNPIKPNSDSLYKVSLDFSTLCRKRLLQQTIQQTLQNALNKNLSKEESIAIRDELLKIQEEGRKIEVACALCYVESARMKSPVQINKFLNNRDSVIKEFFANRSGGSVKEKIAKAELKARKELQKANPDGFYGKNNVKLDPLTAPKSHMIKSDADYIRAEGKKARASYKLTEHEQAELDAAMKMSVDDFTSAKGLENLAKKHPDLFDAYTSYVRNATHSKGIENDTWWRAGDSDSIGDTLIAQMNAENGLRSQSWSDFQVIHLLDYIAATIELSTKGAKRQSYTKVPDYVKLLGNTGDMINMSLIPESEFNGKLAYDGVEGMAYDIAKQLRDEYHATVGTICIGINNEQISMLLEDGTIDMVIPYHHSAMSKVVRKLMHIPAWETYQNYQNEKNLSDADALARANEYGVELKKDNNYHKAPKFSEWFNLDEARQFAEFENKKAENGYPTNKEAYKKYGKMYGGYMAMQNAANNYLKLCTERGLAPKFSSEKADFTHDANYWKLLIDRKMVDNITGEIIEQKAIKPIFKEQSVLEILNDELERYPQVKADQEYATRKVTEKFLSGEMNVDKSTLEAIKKPIDNITNVNILESSKDGVLNFGKIKEGMSEDERYEILKNKEIQLAKVNAELYEKYLKQMPELLNKSLKMTDAKKLLKKIGNEFGVYKEYESKDFNIRFEFGKNNLDESVQKQKGNYEIYAQMLSCFSDVISNAVGIEVHNRNEEGYKPDLTLKRVYVLCSAFENNTDIIPVKLSVKEFSDKANRLYVAVALESIKKDRVESMGVQDDLTHNRTSPVTISIKDIFGNVNIKDGDFLKYIPNGFLNKEQIEAKNIAIENDKEDTVLYSEKEQSVYDTMGETDRVIQENKSLNADVSKLNKIIGTEEIANRKFLALANYLKKLSGSNIDSAILGNKLKDAYTTMQASDSLNWNDIARKTYGIAESIMSNNLNVPVDYFQRVMYEIRKDKISLSDEQRTRVEESFGGYGNFHKYVFGRANITKDGKPLADAWKNWSKIYPSLFDANLQGTEQIDALVELVTTLKTTNTLLSEYERSDAIRYLSTEIYNQFWNIAADSSTVDEANAYRKEHKSLMENLKKSYEKRQKDLAVHPVGETALKYEGLLNKVREQKRKEVAKAKEHGKEMLSNYKENAEKKTRIQRITANALTLNKWLTKNSKDYHIHEAMKGPVIKLLNAIDFSSKSMLEEGLPTQKDISFAEAFSDVKSMLEKATDMVEGLEVLYGHDLAESIDMLSKAAFNLIGDNTYIINAMSNEQLFHLDKLVRHIKKVVTDLNKFHVLNHDKGVVNLGNEFVEHGEKLGNLKKQHGTMGKFFEFRNRTPYYFFKDLGKVGEKLFKAFQDGWDKLSFNVKKIIDFTKETYTDKEVKEWSKETKQFKLPQFDGTERTFEMSIAQIMALHCVSKQKDALNHLLSGGMTLKRIDTKGHVVTDYDNITLTLSDIRTILSSLTDRQKEVADKLQNFMNTVCSAWGNEISMARFGIEMFGIPDYFPIKVSEATVPTDNTKDIDNASLFRLLNMSFTKARNQNAEQSIEIGDIFDIFAQHSSDMAKYNALALPVLDFNKFYSIQGKDLAGNEYGVVKTLKSVFGDEANGYIRRFVRDLNGSQNVSRDVIGNTFFKNAKVASVAANLRVVLLQPTAFFKASAVMDNKYLMKASAYIKVEPVGMVKKLKKAIADAEKYCGIVQWKSLGYYDTDISKGLTEKIKHADGLKDKAIEKSLKLAEIADKVTFGTLWVACEFEIRDTRKDLKVGSKEFYDAIAERLRDVIYATQVVDSTMTRSDMMRSSDGRDKMLTAFGSEPTIAYNMLLDMVAHYNRDKKEFGKEKAREMNSKKIRKVVTAYVITNAVAALVESGFDALRDDDDEEMDAIEFMKLYLKNFAFDMSVGNKLPYIKEVYSLLQGYSSSRMDTQWLQSTNYVMKDIQKIAKGDGDWLKTTKDIIKAMSYVSGLPLYNAFRDAMAILDKLGILDEE